MATKTVNLSSGKEVTFDSSRIKIRDLRLAAGGTDQKLSALARVSGMTDNDVDDLSVDDFLLLAGAFNEVTEVPKAS